MEVEAIPNKEWNKLAKEMSDRKRQLDALVIQGLMTNTIEKKQWFLEQIAEMFKVPLVAVKYKHGDNPLGRLG